MQQLKSHICIESLLILIKISTQLYAEIFLIIDFYSFIFEFNFLLIELTIFSKINDFFFMFFSQNFESTYSFDHVNQQLQAQQFNRLKTLKTAVLINNKNYKIL